MAGLADAFAQIESSGNPLAWNTLPSGRRSRYRGLYQFGPDQERRYGITDWTDVGQQNSAFERHIGTLRGDLTRRLGRAPEDWELYFGHQQGPAGSSALLSAAPGTPAWRAIRQYYGSDAMAQQAISGNIPRRHPLFGQRPEAIMAGDFAQMWRERFGRTGGQPAPFGAPTPVSAPSPVGGPPTAAPGAGNDMWQRIGSGLMAGLGAMSPIGTAQAQTPPSEPDGSRERPYTEDQLPELRDGLHYLGQDGRLRVVRRSADGWLGELVAGPGAQGGPPVAGKPGVPTETPSGPLTPPDLAAPSLGPSGPPGAAPQPAPPPAPPLGPSNEVLLGGPATGLTGARPSPFSRFLDTPIDPTAPPIAPVPPFGAPTVTPAPPPDQSLSDPSTWQPMGHELTRDIAGQLGPPQAPPPDADAIVRGAEQAAASRADQPQSPGYFERLMQNPAFLAGLSILGTAPGGNWGPAGAQAASQAMRARREQTEHERLQGRRTVMDRVWREAFTDGRPNMSHPLMQGLPPEMASTVFAMGPEEGLPALQRWQMFRGQRQEQIREREATAALYGLGPSSAPPAASEEDQAGAGLDRLRAGAGLPGVGAPPVAGAVPWPGGPASSPTAPPGGQPESTVRVGARSMPLSVARARALSTANDGERAVLLQAIAAAERQAQAPPGFRSVADGRLEAIPGGPGEQISAEVAGRLAMMQTAASHLPAAREFFTRSWGPLESGRAAVGGPLVAAEYDRQRRAIRVAIEGALRATTGAAAPESEVTQYMDMFMPRVTDSRETAAQKMNLLEAFMGNARTIIMRGRGGQPPPSGPGSSQPGNDPLGIR